MNTEYGYIDQLNEQQQEAVLYDGGPSLVVAGAGSGKTRVLTYKIAYLIDRGVKPYHILALTFTNKAAREMKSRIGAVTGDDVAAQLWMGTFHSIFYRILRYEAEVIGYPHDFTIYDASDSKSLIKSIIKEMQLDDKVYRATMIQSRISNAKNALVTPEAYEGIKDWMEADRKAKIPFLVEIYRRYRARCYRAGAMDFDDLLMQTNILFRDHTEILDKYRSRFHYVLVDEYQDTNFAQHLIVTRLCEQHRRIFVVGDDAQSIYSFRGANIDNMLRFKEIYPECRIFKLEQNYRSTQNIVDAANSLIHKNKGQIHKTVFSRNEAGGKIVVRTAYSDIEEGHIIAAMIKDMHREGDSPYAGFAVLYRTNAQSRLIEDALRTSNIAYRVYGGQSFYQRKEIKDLIAYFRVVVNPHDEEAVKRIINFPARGIGDTTVGKILSAATANDVSLWDIISSPKKYGLPINAGTMNKLLDFSRMITDLIDEKDRLPAPEMAELILTRSGLKAEYFGDRTVEGISRQENIAEALKAITEFSARIMEERGVDATLADFLVEVSLITDQDNDADEFADKVTLMTAHSAKGLEFDNIFIAGMEENLFPSIMADTEREMEEERRLFYVAITRARKNCVITHANSRFHHGQMVFPSPSRFLEDIDPDFLDYISKKSDNQAFNTAEINRQREPYQRYSPQITRRIDEPQGLKKLESTVGKEAVKRDSIDGICLGDRVAHKMFGEGEVVSLEGYGAEARAIIEFDNIGKKTLILRYAVLTKC